MQNKKGTVKEKFYSGGSTKMTIIGKRSRIDGYNAIRKALAFFQ
jgi:hypothetical protein